MNSEPLVGCFAATDGEPAEPVLRHLLGCLGEFQPRIFTGARVLIKPNFVAPFQHATTDLAFVAFFVSLIRELGGVPVVGESSGFEFETRSTLSVLGVEELARRYNVALVDFEEARYELVDLGSGVGRVEVASLALHADYIINLPVLKGHAITGMTGAVKNLFGLLSKTTRRRLHARGLHRAIAALARHFAGRALHIVDARRALVRAVFAAPEPLGYVTGGFDPFALDRFGCKLLGIDPERVRHLERPGEYRVVGDVPAAFRTVSRRESVASRLRRAAYAASYGFDHLQSQVMSRRSILPALHWHLGIHPELRKDIHPSEVERVAKCCPVGAIDVATRRIRRDRCERVRCLACHRAEPSLVRLRGLTRPDAG